MSDSNVAKDRKKSNFVEQSTIPAGATFDFVINGTNIKITKEDMIAAFGTTGSLEQLGNPVATPILKVNGTVNQIRNLEDGFGVKASVSPQGGALLDHSFVAGSTGIPILFNSATTNPLIRNLLAGTGMSIAVSGNSIQLTATGITVASNIVVINEMSDFPAAVSGVITLAADTAYLVSANLSTANRFILNGGTLLYGPDSSVSSLQYTGVGTMFTALDVSTKIKELSLDCPNGQLLDISGTVPGNIFQMNDLTVTECDTVGTFTDVTAIQITNVAFQEVTTGGMTFLGALSLFIGSRCLFDVKGGVMIDFGSATFSEGFSLEQSFGNLAAGTTFIDGLADSGNIDVGALGTIFDCRFAGAGTILNNISEDDTRWEFKLNDDIPDSINSLLATNAGATVTIVGANTPVIIGATWVCAHLSRFECTAAGLFTYKGKGAHVSINVAISAQLAATPARDCTFYLFKNGSEVTASGIQRSLISSAAASVSMVWQEDLETDDELELFVENNDNTDNIVINHVVLGIIG